MNYVMNVLLGLDQMLNTLIGGQPDETISSRSARQFAPLRAFLSLFQGDHSLKSLEYTPWGTVDPHSLPAVHPEVASDWNALIAVLDPGRDLDQWPAETKAAAERALDRLRTWSGRSRWVARMERDLDVGDRFQA